MWNAYHLPSTLDEALDLLQARAGDARVIAGGTDLVLELERGARRAGALIDISRLAGQDRITQDAGGVIHLGPLATHSQVVASSLCVERAFPLACACRQVGAPQIRNRGTVAGNLITASPANDTITPLMALGAVVTLRSARGARAVALADFYRGVRRTVMAPDEILTDIAFPALDPRRQRGVFLKLGLRRAQAIAVVNCAVVLTAAEGRPGFVVEDARITLGAVAPTIIRAPEAEAALAGRALAAESIERAARLAQAAATPIDDVRAAAWYRREMAGVIARRALTQILEGTERLEWGADPALLWGGVATEDTENTEVREVTEVTEGFSGAMAVTDIELVVNGRRVRVEGAQDKTLLRLLREDCGLTGAKEGCAEGECGACTVLMDGKAVMACLVPAPRAHGASIITVEGVGALAPESAGRGGLHPLQQAFIDQGAVQCGYCTPGFIVSGAALLAEHPRPSTAQIQESISGNLCRCTGYYKILSAFEQAAAEAGAVHE